MNNPEEIKDWLEHLIENKTILSYKIEGDHVYIAPLIPVDHITVEVVIENK